MLSLKFYMYLMKLLQEKKNLKFALKKIHNILLIKKNTVKFRF